MNAAASGLEPGAFRASAAASNRPPRAASTAADGALPRLPTFILSRKKPTTGGVRTDARSNVSARDVNAMGAAAPGARRESVPGAVGTGAVRTMRNGRVTCPILRPPAEMIARTT